MYNSVEGSMKKEQYCGTTKTSMAIHDNSQTIAKVKPKIRIIHIFAPEIIQTDVANFRELVQRLTGKPPSSEDNKIRPTKRRRQPQPWNILPGQNDHSTSSRSSCSTTTSSTAGPADSSPHHPHKPPPLPALAAAKMELRSGFLSTAEMRERIKGKDEEIWRGANSEGGFLGGFAELEGFMEQLNHEFPLLPALPLEAAHHMDSHGQSKLA